MTEIFSHNWPSDLTFQMIYMEFCMEI